MKKLLLFVALILSACSVVSAQKVTISQDDLGMCVMTRFSGSLTHTKIATAIASTGSTTLPDCSGNKTLVITPGTWAIGANLTIPARMNLFVSAGAVLSIANGVTLTLEQVPNCEVPTACIVTTGTGSITFDVAGYSGQSSYVNGSCLPVVPSSSLTFAGFSCNASISVAGVWAIPVHQTSASVTLANTNGIHWLAVCRDTTSAVSGWTRTTGTHYVHRQVTAKPADPTGCQVVTKATVAGSVITAVADFRNFDPRSPAVVNVEYWGASPTATGAANATAIQTALNYAANTNAIVHIPALYPITTLVVANGVRAIVGPGGFQATGQFGGQGAVLELASDVNTLNIESLRFVMSTNGTGAKYGIYGVCSSCVIAHNTMTNFEDINGHNGIYLTAGTGFTRIVGNQISLVQPPLTVGHTAQGIALVGTADAFSGYFTGSGTCTSPSGPIVNMTVTGNTIFGGSHGIWGRALQFSTITGNAVRFSWHRSAELEFSSNHNTVTGNSFSEFYSSALNLSYCSSFNTVASNTAFSTVANGQAPFLAYVGTTDNLFSTNVIRVSGTATVFGIYLAINSSRNTVVGNDISGTRWAGVSVQSDWVDPLPAGADYSLAVDAAESPTGQWAYGASQDNVIQGNIIRAPTGSAAVALSLAAIGSVGGVSGTVIKSNHVVSTAFDYQLHLFEENSTDPVSGTWLTDNTWNTGLFLLGARGQSHFQTISGNYALDYGVVYAFANGDTTPDVTVGSDFVTANAAGTQITFFDGDVLPNREITVRMDVNSGITHDNAKIRLVGGSNIVQGTVDSNFFIHFRNIGGGAAGIWVEMWRRN